LVEAIAERDRPGVVGEFGNGNRSDRRRRREIGPGDARTRDDDLLGLRLGWGSGGGIAFGGGATRAGLRRLLGVGGPDAPKRRRG